uniref:Bicarbonate transporter-like transmembrane domain-containing protein n=1 Tax=Tetranychus urticae TaxID=32264 RepID=T1JV29_TETUR
MGLYIRFWCICQENMIALGITETPLKGHGMEQIRFILIILTPTIEDIFNSFNDHSLRFDLLDSSKESIKEILKDKAAELSTKSNQVKRKVIHGLDTSLWENISRRVRCYHTDFVDGIVGKKTIHKTLATSLFLYFGCILPAIAFGLLNSKNTNGLIGIHLETHCLALVGQAFGYHCNYCTVVYEISEQLDVDFFVMYATVGFWNTLFVLAYAVFGWSKLIKYATRSVEEIFAQFITICFFYDAINDCVESFNKYYHTKACANFRKLTDGELNVTTLETPIICQREDSLLHLLLALGTVWLSLRTYKFNQRYAWYSSTFTTSCSFLRSLADTEERNNQGLIETHIIRVRETRITALLSNILIGLSLFMIPYPLNLISTPVLDGLFLYCAFASFRGSSMFQRICLLFQEQSSYPPNHYVRRARQRIVHLFTVCEIIQLVILVYVGLIAPWAYLKMAFPVFIALLIPVRHFILPIFLDKKTLKLLDSYG